MNFIMKLFGYPLGYIMWAIYKIIPNYLVALILFTIVTKALLIPLAIKQQKGSVKMQRMQPKIMEIQNKYKNNPQKQQEELAALYERENYNMLSGCLPMLIQMPILFGLIDVIYRPLTHLMHVPAAVLNTIKDIMTANPSVFTMSNLYAPEIDYLKAVQTAPQYFSEIGADMVQHIQKLNMTSMGLDLSMRPDANGLWSLLMIIPILSGLTALLQSIVMQKMTPGAENTGAGMKMMTYMMPLMSIWFTTFVPMGVGFYWIFSNIFGLFQSIILNKFWNPKKIAEEMDREEAERREKERQEKIEAKKLAKKTGETTEKALSQKEKDRQKLAEARRRNAEKYGDYGDYETTDKDLE